MEEIHTNWSNNIGMNVIFRPLLRQRFREANQSQLGSRIIALAKASKKTRGRRSINDPSILLFSEIRPSSSSTFVGTLNMNGDDQIPVLVFHVLETDVSEDTSIVDQDIDSAIVLDGGVDDLLAVCDAVVVRYCSAARGFDFIDDDIGGL
jgi:hypothetical protein